MCNINASFEDVHNQPDEDKDKEKCDMEINEMIESGLTALSIRRRFPDVQVDNVVSRLECSPSTKASVCRDSSEATNKLRTNSLSPCPPETPQPLPTLVDTCTISRTSSGCFTYENFPSFHGQTWISLEEKSIPKRAINSHLLRRSPSHFHGNTALESNSLTKSKHSKLFDHSARTRTVTKSRRSGLEQVRNHGIVGNLELTRSGRTSCVLVTRRKAESDFIHVVSADVITACLYTDVKATQDNNAGAVHLEPSPMINVTQACRTVKDIGPATEMKKVGRTESVQNERRGRSLFRTKEHRRSRARSPVNRRVLETNGSKVGAGGSTVLKDRSSKLPWIRRESPSPQPATRKRTWRRKVISRAERDRRAAVRMQNAAGTKHPARALEEDLSVERNADLLDDEHLGRYEDGSSGRLATWG